VADSCLDKALDLILEGGDVVRVEFTSQVEDGVVVAGFDLYVHVLLRCSMGLSQVGPICGTHIVETLGIEARGVLEFGCSRQDVIA